MAAAVILLVPPLLNVITNVLLRARYSVPVAFYLMAGEFTFTCTGNGPPRVVFDAGEGNDRLV